MVILLKGNHFFITCTAKQNHNGCHTAIPSRIFIFIFCRAEILLGSSIGYKN